MGATVNTYRVYACTKGTTDLGFHAMRVVDAEAKGMGTKGLLREILRNNPTVSALPGACKLASPSEGVQFECTADALKHLFEGVTIHAVPNKARTEALVKGKSARVEAFIALLPEKQDA